MNRFHPSRRITTHAERLALLTPDQQARAFHHFLGAIESLTQPKSWTNPGPNREQLARALERAVNSQTGT